VLEEVFLVILEKSVLLLPVVVVMKIDIVVVLKSDVLGHPRHLEDPHQEQLVGSHQ